MSEFPAIIALPLLLFLFLSAGATRFDLNTLTLNTLKLLGDSDYYNGTLMLTRNLPVPNSGAGKVIYSQPIRFRQPESPTLVSFATFFSFSISNLNPSSIGGGLAFVISPDDVSIGDAGGYMGIISTAGEPNGVVAVEFDTLMDVEFKDINGNHVGLDLNSMVSAKVGDLETVGVDLKTGNVINSWVDYSGSTQFFNIYVAYSNIKPKKPLLSFNLDLALYVNDFMFVGFSGSTQGSTEIHCINWWSFSSSFDNGATVVPISALPPPPLTDLMSPSADSVNPPPQSTTVSRNPDKISKPNAGAVVGVVTAGAFILAFFTIILFWVYSKKFKKFKSTESLASDYIKMPRQFRYKQLKLATKNFDTTQIIGHGAFGTVYKGIMRESGDIVAVKRCSHNSQGQTEFLSELSIFGTLRHRNLVKLEGWCHEKDEILLVYEFLANGSLDKVLFESRMGLSWGNRTKILLGVASALAYLHQECESQIIHRDVKTSNVMLDEVFNAKLGDFGLARQVEHNKSPDATVAAGTMGYLAPEYLTTGQATEKTDVFSYGAVVLEVASGRRPIDKEMNGVGKSGGVGGNLVDWVWSLHREGRVLDAADPRLGGEFVEEEMRRVLLVGLACSNPDPAARPTMRSVDQILVGEAQVPVVPKTKPTMSLSTSHLILNLQDSVSDLNGLISISTSSSEYNNNDAGGGGAK